MRSEKSICVFCGSATGVNGVYAEAARRVGRELARQGLGLVYGGGSIGLMGEVASACLDAGGEVVGVITEPLTKKEIAHPRATEMIVVPDMHERKAIFARRSVAFLTMPGGIGTFEEFFEVFSWAVLGIHRKPLGVLNVGGYYDPMLGMVEHAVREGFVREANLSLLRVSTDPERIVTDLAEGPPAPSGPRWMDMSQV